MLGSYAVRDAATLTEWRELRQELDEFKELRDDWCGFTSDSVIAVVTEAGPVWPGCGLSVVEEEGVDVLTATRFSPSGEDPGVHS